MSIKTLRAGELEEGHTAAGGAELAVDAQDFFTEAELEIGRTARSDTACVKLRIGLKIYVCYADLIFF